MASPKVHLAWSLLAVSLVGCAPEFVTAEIEVRPTGFVEVYVVSPEPPCPTIEPEAWLQIDGVQEPFVERAGRARDGAEIVYDFCDDAWGTTEEAPLDGDTFVVEVISAGYPMRFEAPWPGLELRSDDDLAAAMADGSELTVTYTPAELDPPALAVAGEDGTVETVVVEVVSSEPGRIRARFRGTPAEGRWWLRATEPLDAAAATCRGVPSCRIEGSRWVRLEP